MCISEPDRRGRMLNAPASYSGSSGFKSRPGNRLSWLKLSVGFLCPPGKFRESSIKLGLDRFLPNPFQFVLRLSSFHATLCSLSYWESVVSLTTNKLINKIHERALRFWRRWTLKLKPRRWREYVSPKRWYLPASVHCVKTHKNIVVSVYQVLMEDQLLQFRT
jgi:hypothetical protein